jgi:hypothetical protein
LCYARSRRVQKLKDLAQSLITFSIIQSSPYPSASEMDEPFKELTKSPQHAVDFAIANGDAESAYHFVHAFVGYCALRKFYDLRDGEDGAEAANENEMHRGSWPEREQIKEASTERAKEMGNMLVELLRSVADDVIDGEVAADAVRLVPVEVLSALLGELYGFMKRKSSIVSWFMMLTARQIMKMSWKCHSLHPFCLL